MKVAIVADWLTDMGGAERVVLALHDIFPHAPIFTTISDVEKLSPEFRRLDIRHSFLQKIPGLKKHRKKLINFLPMAIEDLDLSEYDVVISSSSSVAHGVITQPHTLHISYCHSPMRYAWDGCQDYVNSSGYPDWLRSLIPYMISPVRIWDYWSSDRVDRYVANSKFVQKRIAKYFHQDSTVIYPPVDTRRFRIAHQEEKKDFFLVVSRMVEFKKVDLAIEACNKLLLPLKVVGTGSYFNEYASMAGPTVEMLGWVSDEEVAALMRECRALVFPQIEDFGITPLEVNASGVPVIAYQAGGALETVVQGRNGVFFQEQTAESLVEAMTRFEEITWDTKVITAHAEKFSYETFCAKFKMFVETEWNNFSHKKFSGPLHESPRYFQIYEER